MSIFSGGKVDRLIQKNNDLRGQVESLRDEIESMKREAREAQTAQRERLESLQRERDEARATLKQNQSKMRSLRDSSAHQSSRTQELETELAQAREKLSQTRAQLTDSEDEVTALQGARAELAAERAEVERLKAEVGELNYALEREPSEIALHSKVFDLTESKERLEERVSQLRARVKKLESERNRAQNSARQQGVTTESKLRELERRLKIEREFHMMLELQVESALSRAKGAEQRFEIKTREAIEEARAVALERVDAELKEALATAQARVSELEATLRAERRDGIQRFEIIAEVVEPAPEAYVPEASGQSTEPKAQDVSEPEPAPEPEVTAESDHDQPAEVVESESAEAAETDVEAEAEAEESKAEEAEA